MDHREPKDEFKNIYTPGCYKLPLEILRIMINDSTNIKEMLKIEENDFLISSAFMLQPLQLL